MFGSVIGCETNQVESMLHIICQKGGHSKSNPLTQPSRGRGRAKGSAGTNNLTSGFSLETSSKTAQLLFQWKELSPGHIENGKRRFQKIRV